MIEDASSASDACSRGVGENTASSAPAQGKRTFSGSVAWNGITKREP